MDNPLKTLLRSLKEKASTELPSGTVQSSRGLAPSGQQSVKVKDSPHLIASSTKRLTGVVPYTEFAILPHPNFLGTSAADVVPTHTGGQHRMASSHVFAPQPVTREDARQPSISDPSLSKQQSSPNVTLASTSGHHLPAKPYPVAILMRPEINGNMSSFPRPIPPKPTAQTARFPLVLPPPLRHNIPPTPTGYSQPATLPHGKSMYTMHPKVPEMQAGVSGHHNSNRLLTTHALPAPTQQANVCLPNYSHLGHVASSNETGLLLTTSGNAGDSQQVIKQMSGETLTTPHRGRSDRNNTPALSNSRDVNPKNIGSHQHITAGNTNSMAAEAAQNSTASPKLELIDADMEDDDCTLVSVDIRRKIFTLDKNLNGAFIDLDVEDGTNPYVIDDDDNKHSDNTTMKRDKALNSCETVISSTGDCLSTDMDTTSHGDSLFPDMDTTSQSNNLSKRGLVPQGQDAIKSLGCMLNSIKGMVASRSFDITKTDANNQLNISTTRELFQNNLTETETQSSGQICQTDNDFSFEICNDADENVGAVEEKSSKNITNSISIPEDSGVTLNDDLKDESTIQPIQVPQQDGSEISPDVDITRDASTWTALKKLLTKTLNKTSSEQMVSSSTPEQEDCGNKTKSDDLHVPNNRNLSPKKDGVKISRKRKGKKPRSDLGRQRSKKMKIKSPKTQNNEKDVPLKTAPISWKSILSISDKTHVWDRKKMHSFESNSKTSHGVMSNVEVRAEKLDLGHSSNATYLNEEKQIIDSPVINDATLSKQSVSPGLTQCSAQIAPRLSKGRNYAETTYGNDVDNNDDFDVSTDGDDSYSSCDSDDDEDVEYRCKICSETFVKKSLFKKHKTVHYSGGNKSKQEKVTCKACRRKYSDTTALQAHLLQRRYCFFDCTRQYWKKKSETLLTCTTCGKQVSCWKDLKKHCYKNLACRLRYINFVLENTNRSSNLSLHSPSHKTSEKPSGSESCVPPSSAQSTKKDINSTVGNALNTIITTEGKHDPLLTPIQSDCLTGQANRTCQSCKITFKSIRLFREHLNALTNSKCKSMYLGPLRDCGVVLNYCSRCDIFKASSFQLQHHTCQKGGQSRCAYCQKIFSTRAGLKAHLSFTSCGGKKASLTENISPKVENANKSMPCLKCDAVFEQLSDLLEHSQTHTDEGEYKCSNCTMTFNRYNGLVSHLIWHEKKKNLHISKTTGTSDEKVVECSNTVLSKTNAGAETQQQTFPCKICSTVLNTKEEHTIHMFSHKVDARKSKMIKVDLELKSVRSELDDTSFKCRNCEEHFPTLNGRNEHYEGCRQKLKQISNTETKVPSGSSRCSLCLLILKNKSFHNHLTVHVKSMILTMKKEADVPLFRHTNEQCLICGASILHKKGLFNHLKRHKAADIMIRDNASHTADNLKKTPLLKKVAEEPTSPKTKMQRKTANKSYTLSCKKCHRKCLNKAMFKLHLKVAHQIKSTNEWSRWANYLQAPAATSDTPVESSLNQVQASSSDAQDVCNNKVLFTDFNKYLEANTKFKPNRTCEICKKTMLKSSYSKHMVQIHGISRNLLREKKSSDMKTAKKNQTGHELKSFSECKSPRAISNATQSRIIVDCGGADIVACSSKLTASEKSWECSVCSMEFARKGNLWRHQFKHTNPCSVRLMRLENVMIPIPTLPLDYTVFDGNPTGKEVSI